MASAHSLVALLIAVLASSDASAPQALSMPVSGNTEDSSILVLGSSPTVLGIGDNTEDSLIPATESSPTDTKQEGRISCAHITEARGSFWCFFLNLTGEPGKCRVREAVTWRWMNLAPESFATPLKFAGEPNLLVPSSESSCRPQKLLSPAYSVYKTRRENIRCQE